MRRILAVMLGSAAFAATLHSATANTASFRDRIDYATSISVTEAVGDLNGDGIPDLFTCGNGGAQAQLGNGDGSFSPGAQYESGSISCKFPLLTDVNGDGALDLLMSFGTLHSSGLAVALGNGDGTFQSATIYGAGSDDLASMTVISDFNHDQILDVAMLGGDGIWVFMGEGGGLFAPGVLVPLTSPQFEGFALAVADLNGDGTPDLAAGTASGFFVLLGNGDGTFQSPALNTSTGQVGSIAVADLNKDGKPDLVITSNAHANTALVLLGNGNGTFQHYRSVNLPNEYFVAIADVNGDGKLDLVSNTGYVAFGQATGKFSSPAYYPSGFVEYGDFQGQVLLPDLRGTGHVDMVVTNDGSFSVLLNKGNGTFIDGTYLTTNGSPSCPIIADFNHDGKQDMAIASNGEVLIYLGTGKGSQSFETPQSIAIAGAYCLAGADFNKDGNIDLAVLSNGTGSNIAAVTTLLGNGAGGFTQTAVLNSDIVLGGPVVADFNRDGNLDLAFGGNAIAFGKGDGTFGRLNPLAGGLPVPNPFDTIVTVADFNGDKAPDLAIPDAFNNTMYILLNQGKGTFALSSFSFSAVTAASCVAADVNGDGKTDLICNTTVGDIAFYLGNGDGTFQLGTRIDVPFFEPGGLLYTDFNGDGIPDIGQVNQQKFGVFQGNGDGTFQMPIWFGAGPEPITPATADLRGQSRLAGVPDVIITDGSGTLLILHNTTP